MPLRVDYLYNRDSDDHLDVSELVKYDSKNNKLEDIYGQELVDLNKVNKTDLDILNSSLSNLQLKIKDIQNQFESLKNNINQIQIDAKDYQNYKKLVDEINTKIDTIDNDIASKVNSIQAKYDILDKKIDENVQILNDKINNLSQSATYSKNIKSIEKYSIDKWKEIDKNTIYVEILDDVNSSYFTELVGNAYMELTYGINNLIYKKDKIIIKIYNNGLNTSNNSLLNYAIKYHWKIDYIKIS